MAFQLLLHFSFFFSFPVLITLISVVVVVAGTISPSTLSCCCCCSCCDFWFDAATFGFMFFNCFLPLPPARLTSDVFGMHPQNWREIFDVHSDSFMLYPCPASYVPCVSFNTFFYCSPFKFFFFFYYYCCAYVCFFSLLMSHIVTVVRWSFCIWMASNTHTHLGNAWVRPSNNSNSNNDWINKQCASIVIWACKWDS